MQWYKTGAAHNSTETWTVCRTTVCVPWVGNFTSSRKKERKKYGKRDRQRDKHKDKRQPERKKNANT